MDCIDLHVLSRRLQSQAPQVRRQLHRDTTFQDSIERHVSVSMLRLDRDQYTRPIEKKVRAEHHPSEPEEVEAKGTGPTHPTR